MINYIKNKINKFKVKRKIQKAEKVLEFIKTAKGEEFFVKKDKQKGSCVIRNGMRNFNDFIFSAGDCARFAKLLALAFPYYKPKILLVKYAKSENDALWEHAIVDFNDFYADIKGIWSPDIAKIRFNLEKVYHIKSLNAPVLKGELHSTKLMKELYTIMPVVDLWFDDINTSKPKLTGINLDEITAIAREFKHQNEPDFWKSVVQIDKSYSQYELSKIPGLLRVEDFY